MGTTSLTCSGKYSWAVGGGRPGDGSELAKTKENHGAGKNG